jgi:hypothetical protein
LFTVYEEVKYMLKTRVFVIAALAAVLNAQELLPELAGWAGKHTAAAAELERQRGEAVAKAAQSYVTALDAVEKAATAKGEIDLVAAVVKEREAAVAGTLEPEFPAALPKARLQGTRKALLAKVESIAADFAKRRKQTDAEYLKALASLQPKAAANPELTKQIAAEKAALLEGSSGTAGGGEKGKTPCGKNVVVNGDFEKVGADGKPEGWKYADSVTVEKEDNNTFVRFVQAVNKDGTVRIQECSWDVDIEVPKNAKTVALSARIRTKDCVLKKVGIPCSKISFINLQEKCVYQVGLQWEGKNGSWKTGQTERPVPKDAVTARVSINNGRSPGQIDFDDIEVTFK